ncbi:MAG: ATP synthase F0 subunit B [Nitrospirae bacterium]|nr:ATP synthase F0 subunit B [Nitrospirota bacterium]MCL5238682.1 ATP synthase F0 subunit B [Nitrospirota bacterium]
MLEFNQWFFVLLANFLVLLFVLNQILFKPLARISKERESATEGALDEAKAMTAIKDEAVARMNAELLAARNKARDVFGGLREGGQAVQKEVMSKAEAQAVEMIEKARKELQAEAEKARAALKADVERFSDEIVRKLVKA